MKRFLLILVVVIFASSIVFAAEDINNTSSNISFDNLKDVDANVKIRDDGASVNSPIELSKINCTIEINGTKLILPKNATGTVSIYLNNTFSESVKLVNGEVNIKIPKTGTYFVLAKYSGDDVYASCECTFLGNFRTNTFIIDAPAIEMYYKNGSALKILLTNGDGVIVSNKVIIINIDGVNYTRTTNMFGIASFKVNLKSGFYPVCVSYNNTSVNTSVTVKSTIIGLNLIKYFQNASKYEVKVLDNQGKPLKDSNVILNINGVLYNKKTNEFGIAKLSINLNVGNYIITAIASNGEQISNNITVLSILESSNLVKYYKNASKYKVKVLDNNGKALSNVYVILNINGVLYNKKTNSEGIASLSINLASGEYILTAMYNNCFLSNNINILSVIESEDIEMTTNTRIPFKAKILDGNGNPLVGESVKLNINGIIYDRISKEDGFVSLNINLGVGNYIITTMYDGLFKSNNVVIKPSVSNKSININSVSV